MRDVKVNSLRDWRWKLAKLGRRLYIRMLKPWIKEQVEIDGDDVQVSEILNEFHILILKETTTS